MNPDIVTIAEHFHKLARALWWNAWANGFFMGTMFSIGLRRVLQAIWPLNPSKDVANFCLGVAIAGALTANTSAIMDGFNSLLEDIK